MRHLLLAAALVAGPPAVAADAPAPDGPPTGPVLHLADGGSVAGELKDSDRPGALRWQSPAFASPLEFPLDAVASVGFPRPAQLPRPEGDYGFELAGGDVVFGSLAGLDESAATIDSPRFGRLRVERPKLLRLDRRRDGSDTIYLGPNGLAGWHVPPKVESPANAAAAMHRVAIRGGAPAPAPPPPAPPNGGWREEAGQLVTDAAGASLRADLGLPARSAVEFEISWTKRPDFVLALGVAVSDPSARHAFRFEVWGDDLVAFREGDREADVVPLGAVGDGPGRVQLQAYLDQESGRMIVATPGGKGLADLRVHSEGDPTPMPGVEPSAKRAGNRADRVAYPCVQLTNVRGDVRLEWLRVARWDGEPPRGAHAGPSRIFRADGTSISGRVLRYDAASKEFVVREEGEGRGESRVAADRVASAVFSAPADEAPRAIRASYQDGSRLSGELAKVEGGAVLVNVPGVEGALRLSVAGLGSLAAPRQAAPAEKPEWTPRLELEGVRLRGQLADGRGSGIAGPIAWRPAGAELAVPLRRGVAGRVVFREPPPPAPKPPVQRARQAQVVRPAPPAGIGARIFNALAGNGTPGQPPPPSSTAPLAIHLRTGDVIPSEITRIDEQGVSFRSPLTASTFIPHDKIKAVELARDESADVRLNRTKRERLLTLPRMQKGSPPTQLIRSRNGDYLRGRVVAMDDKRLEVEVHLETKEVARDRVGRIIWFHADELDDAKRPAAPDEPAGATRVQALRRDGVRLTFLADRLADGVLAGKSDVLGACRVALDEVDQLLIGGAIERAAAQVAYGPWRLRNAPEPKAASGDGPTASGTESPLVGQPAPDFTLDLLGGKSFHLAEAKGSVVLLDFWATWCGPCLQAMPQVEAVAEEFKDRGVKLIAVNLEEDPKQITSMLERHKMHPTVALDRDGVVARKYEANAIPQTVVIGRDGKVARLFVGGGPHLADQLREALNAVLAEGGAD